MSELSGLISDLARIRNERDLLADALGRLAVASGAIENQPLTGPQLLLLADDLIDHLKRTKSLLAGLDRIAAREPDADTSATLLCNPKEPEGQRWGGMIQAGREAPDSDMVGAASYAMGHARAMDALEYMLREFGVWDK